MFRNPAHLNTYHRCGTQERQLDKGSFVDSWESSAEFFSNTSGVRADADPNHDLVTDVQQVPQQYLDL